MKSKPVKIREVQTEKLFVVQESPQEVAVRQAQELAEERQSDEEHRKTCPHCTTDEAIYLCYLQRAMIKAFQMGRSEADVVKEVKRMWRGFQ
jgi:hypothetical protein